MFVGLFVICAIGTWQADFKIDMKIQWFKNSENILEEKQW